MKRADRLLAIVLKLQTKKQVRAEDLANIFEVNKRTIYRDMLALDEAGVPIVSIPGQGYSLVEGYFLPPLIFTIDEAIMLMMGADFVGQKFDTAYQTASQSAQEKIFAVLTEQRQQEIQYLKNNIHLMSFNEIALPDSLQKIREAIIQCHSVTFGYNTRYKSVTDVDAVSLREVDPYGLFHIYGVWMLVAYCHTRNEIRHFRLDRMENVDILNKVFKRPADFTMQLGNQDNRTHTVRVLFDKESASRVQERPSGYQTAQEQHGDELLVTFNVRKPEDILNWLLGWGSHIRVLEPESLREMLINEAKRILENNQF